MLPRPSDHIRVCVRGRPTPALADYLASLGWPGDAPALRELITTLGGLVDTIALDMDVSDEIAPRLGIECRFEGWRQPAHEPRWTPFLNWLVERQLCTPDKREALLAWPQIGYHRFPDERAPRGLIRALNHIKLVVVPGQPLAAKGYLWFGHRTAAFIRSLR
jgi:hypothetical protein